MATENEQAIQSAYDAFGTGDLEAIKQKAFAPNMKWTWPGTGQLSGVYQDIDSVLGLFVKLATDSNGTFKVEPESIKGFDDFVIVCSTASWTGANGAHRDPYTQTFRMANGRATECTIQVANPALWDAFPS